MHVSTCKTILLKALRQLARLEGSSQVLWALSQIVCSCNWASIKNIPGETIGKLQWLDMPTIWNKLESKHDKPYKRMLLNVFHKSRINSIFLASMTSVEQHRFLEKGLAVLPSCFQRRNEMSDEEFFKEISVTFQ